MIYQYFFIRMIVQDLGHVRSSQRLKGGLRPFPATLPENAKIIKRRATIIDQRKGKVAFARMPQYSLERLFFLEEILLT